MPAMTLRSRFTRLSRVALALTVLGIAASAAPALAQRTPTASETALARQEFDAGLRAARGTQWEEARQRFARSYELAPRPVTLLNLAGAQAQSGQVVAATESYRRFLATANDRDKARYREEVERALAAADARIGRAEFQITGLAESDAVQLDGTELARASLALALPLDPGSHVVAVTRAGTEVGRSSFTITEGGSTPVALEVPPMATVPSAEEAARAVALDTPRDERAATQPVVPRDTPADEGGGLLSSPWFWVVTGVVVAGAATATVLLVTQDDPADPFQGTLMPGSIVVD
jgi:hypothetical protein